MDVADPDHAAERAHKRSYDTPLVTREYRAVNAPLGCEYPALRFLERLGVSSCQVVFSSTAPLPSRHSR
jgi:hypothetical protein